VIDADLERRIKDCQELLILWKNLRDFLIKANAGHDINHDTEVAFLGVKSEIAIRHDSLMDSLPGNQANAGQTVLDIVIRSITMRHVHQLSAADLKKIDQEWHDSFMLLTEVISTLEDERKRLAAISPFSYNMAKIRKTISSYFFGFIFSGFTKIAAILLLSAAVFLGVDEYMWSKKDSLSQMPLLKAWYPITKWYRDLVGFKTD
jgi:hypothetical protein